MFINAAPASYFFKGPRKLHFILISAEGGEPMNISKFAQKSHTGCSRIWREVAYEYGNQEIEQEHLAHIPS